MNGLDFGYPWWLSYGHLAIFAVTAALLAAGYRGQWPRRLMAIFGVVALWAGSVFLLIHFGADVNGAAALPTENFLRAGTGHVLDIGAGTGRSSIMVLTARPQVTLVALDLFGESYGHHFGHHAASPQDRLRANLKTAGVEQRVTIETADMRKLPFEAASFDAVVSSYAMDHLNRAGSVQALAEAGRVLKPGGEFLLMVIENDQWVKLAFGPLLSHGGTRGAAWWTAKVQEAGFDVIEQGVRPATLYVLSRRR